MVGILVWLNTALSVFGTWLVTRKRREGFLVWMLTGAVWIAYDIRIGAYSQASLFAVYFILAVYGWVRWKTE